MALNGEKLSDKAQQRIKKLVGNHIQMKNIQSKVKGLEAENTQLRGQVRIVRGLIVILIYKDSKGSKPEVYC